MQIKKILFLSLVFGVVLLWAENISAQTNAGSQCSSGTCGQQQSGCTHDSDASIVQSQCSSCSGMSDYLAKMVADCESRSQSSLVGGDCNNISASGYYGACAATYASQYSGSGGTDTPGDTTNDTPGDTSTSSSGEKCSGNFEEIAGVCFPTGTGLSDQSMGTIVKNLLMWLLGIFGFIAIIAFAISGIQYLTSAGDDKAIEAAKRNMKWSIVGVVVALAGYVIIMAIDAALNATTYF